VADDLGDAPASRLIFGAGPPLASRAAMPPSAAERFGSRRLDSATSLSSARRRSPPRLQEPTHMAPPKVTETATKARQGSQGKPVLLILAASLAAIVVLYFVIGAFMTETSPGSATTGGPAAGISTEQANTSAAGNSNSVVSPAQDGNAMPPSSTSQGTSN
jgi:hypothetical protein